jgi:hypothetical protein
MNISFQTFLQDLSPTASTDYSLWKAAKKAQQATNSSHPLRTTEVQTIISNLKPKSSPGYIITGQILQELPRAGIKYLTQIFNAAMFTGYFLAQWKPGKPPMNPCPTGR